MNSLYMIAKSIGIQTAVTPATDQESGEGEAFVNPTNCLRT